MTLPFQTPGYEDMQLSTQLVIAEALARDIEVEVLDRADNFIRLRKGDRTEFIKEATKTSLDSYVTSEVLGNKWVAKQLMQEAGLSVPEAKLYTSAHEAFEDWPNWEKQPHVVKPTNTNYGIGISIFEEPTTQTQHHAALEAAFAEDHTVLVESFLPGIECRFLVIGDECVAVLQRIPANVTGDGERSIRELVDQKNDDPQRGKGYKTPLEFIQLGEVELGILADQGLTPDSVPEPDQSIFLRKNSNISTGGDSIDQTDSVHPGYKEVAIRAAQSVNARVCGVDIMLAEPEATPNSQNYGIIEVNYNPVLYFHDFPYKGENRRTAQYLLKALDLTN